ncbi:hypothetical protein [Flocculibacter collagenilyticus]|uniref:hypothetical protein n=1 Tax=Flocculibacter collagenilyticus TaxID=2744479 RepID=UPI0018F4797D|nr:hypothetical protein [Flocculibacter collagenilyticus]
MLRVKESALKTLDEKKYFREELFTGISYKLLSNKVEVNRYYQGLYVNSQPEEQDLRRVNSANEVVVDYDTLTASDSYSGEPLNFRGDPYNGLAYDFEDDILTGKHEYVNGIQVSTISWFKSGEIEHISFSDKLRTNEVEWRKNGSLVLAELSCAGKYMLTLECNENDQVTSINAEDNFDLLLDDLTTNQVISPLKLEIIKKRDSYHRLNLSGSSMTEQLLKHFFSPSNFTGLSELTLFDTEIALTNLPKLFNHKNLNNIQVYDERAETKNSLQMIKSNFPNCKIALNSEVII